jgi:hypothetical protein
MGSILPNKKQKYNNYLTGSTGQIGLFCLEHFPDENAQTQFRIFQKKGSFSFAKGNLI